MAAAVLRQFMTFWFADVTAQALVKFVCFFVRHTFYEGSHRFLAQSACENYPT